MGCSEAEAELCPGLVDFAGAFGGKMPDAVHLEPDHAKTNEQIGSILPRPEQFKESDSPPQKPCDPFFKLELTTMYVSSSKSYDIGNKLLDFLATDVVSSVTKLTHKKFAIKAQVFVGSVMCAIKIRVYDETR